MQREHRPVRPPAAHDAADAHDSRLALLNVPAHCARVFPALLWRHQNSDVLADSLARGEAEHLPRGGVERLDDAVLGGRDDPVRRGLDDCGQSPLVRAPRFVRASQRRQISNDDVVAHDGAVRRHAWAVHHAGVADAASSVRGFPLEIGVLASKRALDVRSRPLVARLAQHLAHRNATDGVGRPPKPLDVCLVREHVPLIGVDVGDKRGDAVDDRVRDEARIVVGFLPRASVSDVGPRACDLNDRAGWRGQRHSLVQHPSPLPVGE